MILDIFAKEQISYNEFELFCLKNNIRQMLEYYKVPNSLIYINTTLSIVVTIDPKFKYGYNIDFDQGTDNVLPSVMSNLSMNMGLKGANTNVWEQDKLLLNNGPIIVGIDPFYLDYQVNEYQNIHYFHTAILAGYSSDEKRIKLIDWLTPWLFKGTVDLEGYLAARTSENPMSDSSMFSGRPINNFWVEIKRDGWPVNVLDMLYETVNLSIKQYYDSSSNEEINVFYGIKGLRKILEILNSYLDVDIERRRLLLSYIHMPLFLIMRKRVFFKFYLDYFINQVRLKGLQSLSLVLQKLSQRWEKLLYWVFKTSKLGTSDALNKVISNFNEILIVEESLYDDLAKLQVSL